MNERKILFCIIKDKFSHISHLRTQILYKGSKEDKWQKKNNEEKNAQFI